MKFHWVLSFNRSWLFVLYFIGLIGHAQIHQVGPTRTYISPNALYVANVVQDGDIIEIDAADYSGQSALAVWQNDNLIIRGVGGRPHLIANGANIIGKGIWVLQGNDITVENIEFSGATVPDENGAGIRLDGTGMTVRNCYFHDNENGILTNPSASGGDILIEYTEFDNNGFGEGQTHNLYINQTDNLTFRYNYSHHAKIGHNLKSRARNNFILYNRIMDEASGNSSRLIDLPNGGPAIIMGNLLMQGPNAPNNNLIGYGLEGLSNPGTHELYVINNSCVNKRTASSLFVSFNPSTAVTNVSNNILAGIATIASGTLTTENNNLEVVNSVDAGFANESNYDYSLVANSPAIDFGTAMGAANGTSLSPDFEYLHPTNANSRTLISVIDAGAYEYQGNVTGPTANAGPDQSIDCVNLSVILDGSGSTSGADITYNWSTANGNIVSGGDTDRPTVDSGGTYTLTVTDTSTNQTATDQVSVTENNTPPQADAGQDVTIIEGGSTQLNASSGVSYVWSPTTGLDDPNIASPVASPSQSTTYTVTVTGANGCTATDQMTVTVTPAGQLVANAGPDSIIDCDNLSVILDGSGSTSGADIIYNWSTANGNIVSGGDTDRPTVDSGGTYTLTVTDTSTNQTATDQVSVTEDNTPPQADAGQDVTILAGQSTQLIATSGVSYVWSPTTGLDDPNIANPVASPSLSTTYTVTVTGTNGCTAADQVTVTIAPAGQLVANAGPDNIIDCDNLSAILDGSGSTSGADITYSWSTTNGNIVSGGDTDRPTVDSGGTYTLTVTDNSTNRTATDEVTVTEDQTPPQADAGQDITILEGESTQLNATGGLSYVWSPTTGLDDPNIANPVASPSQSTTYTVTVTGTNGCTATDQVTVTVTPAGQVVANAGPDRSIDCNNPSEILDGSGSTSGADITYSWSTTNGNIVSGGDTDGPTVDSGGTYTLTVTDTSTDQTATDQVSVTEDNTPPQADAGQDITILEGESTQLNATGGLSYVWSPATGLDDPNIASPVASPGQTATYTVTVTGANGCTATDQVTVTIAPAGQLVANAGPDNIIDCDNLSAILDGSGSTSGADITYSWSTTNGNIVSGGDTDRPTVDSGGTYTLTVTDTSTDQTATDQVSVTEDNTAPQADAGQDVTILAGQSTQLNASGSVSYVWSPTTGLDDPNIANPVASPSQSTTYTVTVTGTNGCTESDTISVTVQDGEGSPIEDNPKEIVLPNAFSPNADGMNDLWNVPLADNFSSINLTIYNRNGQEIYRSNSAEGWDGTYKGEPLPMGAYYYLLQIDGQEKTGVINLIR